MMTIVPALVMALSTGQNPPTAATVVSKMIARYSASKATVGKISFFQTYAGVTIRVETRVQFQAPSKIFLEQERFSSDPRRSLLVSDGKHFAYDIPAEVGSGAKGRRLVETVFQGGSNLTYREMYAIAGAGAVDRSAPLDLIIGRTEDLKYRRSQWATLDLAVGKDGLHVVRGQWRDHDREPISGSYRMTIDSKGNLLTYEVEEALTIEGRAPDVVKSVWRVDVQVDGQPQEGLFRLAK